MAAPSAQAETEAIPARVRAEAYDRDNGCCRVCGSHAEQPALHHIEYRSEGGLNVIENVITVHWMFWPRCHELVHSNKRLWQPVLLEVVKHDGINARQLLRWARAAGQAPGVAQGSG